MRVLFTCVAATGHVHPLVPVARAMAEAGHDVVFATHAAMAPLVERAGFRHVSAGHFPFSEELADFWAELGRLEGDEAEAFGWAHGFVGILATRMASDLLALPEARSADLIVRDNTEFGACVAAECLGRPHAAVSVLAAGLTPGARQWIAGPLDRLRLSHGLPPDPQAIMPFRYLTLHAAPPSFLNNATLLATLLPTDQLIRPVPFDRSGDEALPTWLARLPCRPTVYATLGTVFNGRTEIFEAILAGLRDEPLNVVLTVGRDQDPASFGPRPPHVRIERYIPQTQLLPFVDLVLTHGGSGTVMAALAHGLPLVVVPIGADQPENAARCVSLGVGRALDPKALTPATVRGAVRTVFADPTYRRNARDLRDEIRSLPGLDYAVALLERLAAEQPPRAALTA
jgi:UDP:flavonoid glycosyltransferase YjiC (YdhE family)